jgi:maltose O-acetyltransferase
MYYPDAHIRKLFWQKTQVKMGEGTFANPGMIVVDDYTSGECLLSIGDRVSIAPNVIFVAYSVPNNSPRMQQHPEVKGRLGQRAKIVIEDDVWIGAHVTILPGLRIGRGAIIGAGAVVNRDVAPYTIVAGVPARVLRQIDPLREGNIPQAEA